MSCSRSGGQPVRPAATISKASSPKNANDVAKRAPEGKKGESVIGRGRTVDRVVGRGSLGRQPRLRDRHATCSRVSNARQRRNAKRATLTTDEIT